MSQITPARPGQVRIGDAERDQAVTLLSEHFVAGRLTQQEFEERSDQVTEARYADDLSPLFGDLPDPPAAQPTWSPGLRPGYPTRSRPPLMWLAPVLVVGVVVAAIVLAAPVILWVLLWIALFSGFRRHRWHHHPGLVRRGHAVHR